MTDPRHDPDVVSVAIPVLNGEATLPATLDAIDRQQVDRRVELVVVDSGSSDRSRELCRAHGAAVTEIPSGEFSHGGTRNLLMERAQGAHVAFLTQDAEPADERWLARLLEGFELADDVGLVCGPYVPRPGASPMVCRELRDYFASMAPDGGPRAVRYEPGDPRVAAEHWAPTADLFFSDANGAVARRAWERVPFRRVRYAEDRLLARDMLAAGFAKVFHPDAAVVHSHEYGPVEQFRRAFDEWRGLREVSGHIEVVGLRETPLRLRREVRADVAYMRSQGVRGTRLAAGAARSLGHHALRTAGAAAGSRADRLPPRVRRGCSLERRDTFEVVA